MIGQDGGAYSGCMIRNDIMTILTTHDGYVACIMALEHGILGSFMPQRRI